MFLRCLFKCVKSGFCTVRICSVFVYCDFCVKFSCIHILLYIINYVTTYRQGCWALQSGMCLVSWFPGHTRWGPSWGLFLNITPAEGQLLYFPQSSPCVFQLISLTGEPFSFSFLFKDTRRQDSLPSLVCFSPPRRPNESVNSSRAPKLDGKYLVKLEHVPPSKL